MNPQRAPATRFCAMSPQDIDAVLHIETAAYEFPWSRGNFIDSLSAGHAAQLMCDAQGQLLGYFVAMLGVEEMHLLNLTVAPDVQGRGHGRHLLGVLVERCRSEAAHSLWLEVRQSNRRAQFIYEQFGFRACGLRKGYYPAAQGRREDAVVMRLHIASVSVRACNEVE
jgi:[ribosomal protein S18]-alanine N-acetyltransferase